MHSDDLVLYRDQDTSLWDTGLIEKGFYYLQRASRWPLVSKYHPEASIAYWYTIKKDSRPKRESVLSLYDALLRIDPLPVGALNRICALARVLGHDVALRQAKKLPLQRNRFYHLLLSELLLRTDRKRAWQSLRRARKLCRTATERDFISGQIAELSGKRRGRRSAGKKPCRKSNAVYPV